MGDTDEAAALSAALDDLNIEEHDEDDADEAGSEATTEDEDSVGGGNCVEGGKKKKKKKKKKKSKNDGSQASGAPSDNAPSTSSSPGSNKADKAESERRFNSAIEDVRSGSEMWIKLSCCNIFDAKTKKLLDALKNNDTVTSLDLSQNHISDEGAQTIAAVLGMNGAPELIELDLRDNTFTDIGLTALDGLKRLRKQLDLKVGSLQPPVVVEEAAATDLKDLTKGPMFRRYFQVGDQDEEEASSSYSNQENQASLEGGLSPEELWGKIEQLIPSGCASIPELMSYLQHLTLQLNRELLTLNASYPDSALDGVRPHIKGCVHHLTTLDTILRLTPTPVTAQYATTPQPAIGTHRLWAAEALALVLGPGNTVIDRCVAAAKLVPRTLDLAIRHPLASALQTRALRIMRSCCVSRVPDLLTPLFTHGLGSGCLKATESSEPCEPLHVQLAELGTAVVGVPSGRRSPVIGFVIELCKILTHCSDESKQETFNAGLKKILSASEAWQAFVEPGGPLFTLTQEQEGDLGGPRAVRPAMEEGRDMAEMAGGGLISGHEILALLQGMGAMGVMSG